MKIEQIHVDGFGVLSRMSVGPLQNGLNVVYGSNGSGKTTLLHLIRGILCGYGEGQRLRLIPPFQGGTPGGRLTVRTADGRFDMIRHSRPDFSDTLAVYLHAGSEEGITTLRQQIKHLNSDVVRSVFCVSGPDINNLQALVTIALQDEIELCSRSTDTSWISEQIREVEKERADLLQESPPRGEIADLEQCRLRLQTDLAEAKRIQQSRWENWRRSLEHCRETLRRREQEVQWLNAELQSVETDLSEVECRLWSRKEKVVHEVEKISRPITPTPSNWLQEIGTIDREITNAQQVLRDLAASRMRISVRGAELTGADAIPPEEIFRSQRESLADLEKEALKLANIIRGIEDAQTNGTGLCQNTAERIHATLAAMHNQIQALCREIGRQQSAHNESQYREQREDIDRCELELSRQIQRLRARRHELLQQRSLAQQVRLLSDLESAHCRCEGHLQLDPAEMESTLGSVPQVIVREKVAFVSAARAGDRERQQELHERRQQLRQQWLEAVDRRRVSRQELDHLEQGNPEITEDRTIQSLRYDYAVVEQRLADDREQWQSLALLQTVLRMTQKKLSEELPSPIIARASELLNELTEKCYRGFEFDQQNRELRIVNAAGTSLPPRLLSRGTLEQATLCFRLALALEYQNRGVHLPLILDDVLADSDETRLLAAVKLLISHASQQQVIFFTCQERLLALFESEGASIQCLPGTSSPPKTEPAEARQAAIFHEASSSNRLDRVQPDEPFWIQLESPVDYVPSLGSQMVRRLGALGVRTVGDLIDLDPELADIPLQSLQISAATLRNWQSEARLLCCVPSLTGRDGQLLVACGVQTPGELAECDVDDLFSRIRRLQSQHESDLSLPWLSEQPHWPSRETVARWISLGKKARTLHEARSSAPLTRPHWGWRSRKANAQRPEMTFRIHDTESEPADLRFYLSPESPIVDAPSIGPKTAEALEEIGIINVANLLHGDPHDIASRLGRARVTSEVVRSWQQQAELMCRVAELRGHDSQILVACGITNADQLVTFSPTDLLNIIEPFALSREGRRLLRSSNAPDLKEVTSWIENARRSSALRAA